MQLEEAPFPPIRKHSGFRNRGATRMHQTILAALGAATMAFASPAIAQDFPVKGGDYWTVAEVTIDD